MGNEADNYYLFGTSSVFKTRTAKETASYVSSQEIRAVSLSRGAFFRWGALQLANQGLAPERLSENDITNALRLMEFKIIDNMLQPVGNDKSPLNHTHESGSTAASFAKTNIFQEFMNQYLDIRVKLLKIAYPIIIIEGRVPAKNGGLSFFITANLPTAVAIKKIECPEVNPLSDLAIAADIEIRNGSDFEHRVLPQVLNGAYIIYRPDPTDETQQQIVKTIGDLIISQYNGKELPKTDVIFPPRLS